MADQPESGGKWFKKAIGVLKEGACINGLIVSSDGSFHLDGYQADLAELQIRLKGSESYFIYLDHTTGKKIALRL